MRAAGLWQKLSGFASHFWGRGNAPGADSTLFVRLGGIGYDNATVYYLPGTTGWSNTFAGVPALLWNPVIRTSDSSFGVRSNQFGFNIAGTANIPIEVRACADLTSSVWLPLQSVTLTNGLCYFSEPGQTKGPGRYYTPAHADRPPRAH